MAFSKNVNSLEIILKSIFEIYIGYKFAEGYLFNHFIEGNVYSVEAKQTIV